MKQSRREGGISRKISAIPLRQSTVTERREKRRQPASPRNKCFTTKAVYAQHLHSVVSDSSWPHWLYSPWNSPGRNTGVGSLPLLQVIFPTQGLNSCLPDCRHILYQLSHWGSPRILEWVAYPFSSESSWPRNQARSPALKADFFTSWVTRQAH